jgi:hypothetical protein
MPRMRSEDQLGFDEEVIENPDVEAALVARQAAKDALSSVRKDYDAAHEKAKGALAMIELPEEGAVRIGRFRISKSLVSAKSVSFETKESTRLRITFMSEDAEPRSRDDDDRDVRPRGPVNADELRGEVRRATEPTPFRRRGAQPLSH